MTARIKKIALLLSTMLCGPTTVSKLTKKVTTNLWVLSTATKRKCGSCLVSKCWTMLSRASTAHSLLTGRPDLENHTHSLVTVLTKVSFLSAPMNFSRELPWTLTKMWPTKCPCASLRSIWRSYKISLLISLRKARKSSKLERCRVRSLSLKLRLSLFRITNRFRT